VNNWQLESADLHAKQRSDDETRWLAEIFRLSLYDFFESTTNLAIGKFAAAFGKQQISQSSLYSDRTVSSIERLKLEERA
jgi:hypothetical protein